MRVAILDMNNDKPNQGMPSIEKIVQEFFENQAGDYQVFNVRGKNQLPEINDFDVFISSGGPGTPFKEGHDWEVPFCEFLDNIWEHNQNHKPKKYLFLICHSFQIACIHWQIGKVTERYSYSFGIMPTHKTEEGLHERYYNNLPDPFYVVDSRQYQVIQPNDDLLDKMGAQIVSLEKIRPHVDFERAVMSIRFSDQIFGTQFHPEANAVAMQKYFELANKKEHIIETYGELKYYDTLDKIDDPDKIILTGKEILPNFLTEAQQHLQTNTTMAS